MCVRVFVCSCVTAEIALLRSHLATQHPPLQTANSECLQQPSHLCATHLLDICCHREEGERREKKVREGETGGGGERERRTRAREIEW